VLLSASQPPNPLHTCLLLLLLLSGKPLLQLVVKPETALIRPYVVAAVLRGVTFDATRYTSFIDLQVRWDDL
jgi:phenylalanyl-tRNA synthetase beta chain